MSAVLGKGQQGNLADSLYSRLILSLGHQDPSALPGACDVLGF